MIVKLTSACGGVQYVDQDEPAPAEILVPIVSYLPKGGQAPAIAEPADGRRKADRARRFVHAGGGHYYEVLE